VSRRQQTALWLLFAGPIAVFSVWAVVDNTPLYFKTLLNGLTLASLYFLVASGFTLVFGLMRNVNLAHGSLYLLGAYVGWVVGDRTGSWLLAVAAGFLSAAIVGLLLQVLVFRFMEGPSAARSTPSIRRPGSTARPSCRWSTSSRPTASRSWSRPSSSASACGAFWCAPASA
jgi:branched-chain amino acid transport system permease protein